METLRLFLKQSPVSVLGPGLRAVIWVQGCPFRCPGCVSPESLDTAGGEEETITRLASWVLEQPGIEGVTFSGGEPMAQAEALCRLVDAVRARADLGVVCYTGYTLEHLRERSAPDQAALLERIDLLIDGPYVESLHGDLLWRGSTNQRILCLTERYAGAIPEHDRSGGLQVFVSPAGQVCIAGVPPEPGLGRRLHNVLNDSAG